VQRETVTVTKVGRASAGQGWRSVWPGRLAGPMPSARFPVHRRWWMISAWDGLGLCVLVVVRFVLYSTVCTSSQYYTVVFPLVRKSRRLLPLPLPQLLRPGGSPVTCSAAQPVGRAVVGGQVTSPSDRPKENPMRPSAVHALPSCLGVRSWTWLEPWADWFPKEGRSTTGALLTAHETFSFTVHGGVGLDFMLDFPVD
jgi:hypothetical protein